MGLAMRCGFTGISLIVFLLTAGGPIGEAQSKEPIGAKVVSPAERQDILSRASVWRPPSKPIAQARLDGGGEHLASATCRFEITELSGTARKSDCLDQGGERLRVKYGSSPEIPSEVASARLLRALGFGADPMTLAERLRCYGCPSDPFVVMKAVDLT